MNGNQIGGVDGIVGIGVGNVQIERNLPNGGNAGLPKLGRHQVDFRIVFLPGSYITVQPGGGQHEIVYRQAASGNHNVLCGVIFDSHRNFRPEHAVLHLFRSDHDTVLVVKLLLGNGNSLGSRSFLSLGGGIFGRRCLRRIASVCGFGGLLHIVPAACDAGHQQNQNDHDDDWQNPFLLLFLGLFGSGGRADGAEVAVILCSAVFTFDFCHDTSLLHVGFVESFQTAAGF